MSSFIELPSGVLIDLDSLLGLWADDDGTWYSDTTDDSKWEWDEKDIPLIREGLLNLEGSMTPFTCQYCGGHNEA